MRIIIFLLMVLIGTNIFSIPFSRSKVKTIDEEILRKEPSKVIPLKWNEYCFLRKLSKENIVEFEKIISNSPSLRQRWELSSDFYKEESNVKPIVEYKKDLRHFANYREQRYSFIDLPVVKKMQKKRVFIKGETDYYKDIVDLSFSWDFVRYMGFYSADNLINFRKSSWKTRKKEVQYRDYYDENGIYPFDRNVNR